MNETFLLVHQFTSTFWECVKSLSSNHKMNWLKQMQADDFHDDEEGFLNYKNTFYN